MDGFVVLFELVTVTNAVITLANRFDATDGK